MFEHEATIGVYINGCRWTKVFRGTDDAIHEEAYDFKNILVAQYIHDNLITDPVEQDNIINDAYYEFSYDIEPYSPGYAVVDNLEPVSVRGFFATRVDAEEFVFSLCEEFAYETMMEETPADLIGTEAYDYKEDYYWLMKDAGRSFEIMPCPAFGYQMEE